MPNFDTFVESLHNYVKRTEDSASKKYRFQETFGGDADKTPGDMQDAFFAGQRRHAGARHAGTGAAKADPA